jgi:hypothetical protein
VAVQQAVEYSRSRRLANGGGNPGGTDLHALLCKHTFIVDESRLHGNRREELAALFHG